METKVFERSAVIELLSDLVKIQSPYFQEHEVMEYTNKWFQRNGIPSSIHSYIEDKVTHFRGENVVTQIQGKRLGPKICFNGHLDTVELCNGWTKNPWGELDGDRFYGVGSVDMTGGVVAQMLAIKAFYEKHKNDFCGEIIGTFVSDEEGPYGLGTDAVLNSGILDGTDAVIICEPNAAFCDVDFPSVSLGCHGIFSLNIELHGMPAHASKPNEGVNAITDAAKVIIEIEKIKYRIDPQMGKSVSCVLGIENNGEPCSVPEYAKINIIRHTVPGDTKETVEKEIVDAIKYADIKCKWKINFREAPSKDTDGFLAYTVAEDNAYTKQLLTCVKDGCGMAPSVTYFTGCCDGCYLSDRLNGVPVYLFGPTGEKYHGSDEYVTISSIIATAKTLYGFLERTLLA
ncbi:M20/M25/M40 family metallo-hydrolase [Oscillibacter sp. MSJ-2]|uniref:M20/M25/M40 family metallo-hydrolase n=1 Tax=Dysosmobacter acutus TaxID=2841504 RepID=A0ABS6FD79_9FIRM|nr:M20/M25/M40 family metallo-hydrolase [Dysosmobacter acutus]MBU5628232.1 M20/M25/M40 family metallo-hydrolase [Dysosmobacter acutus]